jgi:hypothetical protein
VPTPPANSTQKDFFALPESEEARRYARASSEVQARKCVRTLDAGFPVCVVINNKAEGSAPLNVEKLTRRTVEHRANLLEDA